MQQAIKVRFNGAVVALELNLGNDAASAELTLRLTPDEARALVHAIEDTIVTRESSVVQVQA